ncbi:uncharacterized protein LOC143922087 [Arctopsyche grandis]|uniref:uncharacterized protein LOC143922087 n=1 Tax=Arctopsyche grandis TaxID=121162 RepID=UPI00406DA326
MAKMKWFEWVTKKAILYLKDNTEGLESEEPISAALTFSYPLKQKTLGSATVASCEKAFAFNTTDLVGSNVVDDLNKEFEKTTYVSGIARGVKNPIALIVGTGTNSGFSIETDHGYEIIDSNMAKFKISDELLDNTSKELIKKDSNLFPLEITVADGLW